MFELTKFLWGLLLSIVGIVFYIWLVKKQTKLFTKWAEENKTQNIVIYMIVTFFLLWLGYSTFIALIMFGISRMKKYNQIYNKRIELYNELAADPTVEKIDNLMAFIEEHSCPNDPQSWNRLRAVWFACNESSNIPTEKKKEFKQFLMLKGLSMHYQDAQVINNYKG